MARPQHRTSPGSTYFVTTKSFQRAAIFQSHSAANIIVTKLLHYRDAGAYHLHAFVLMPDQLHLLFTPCGSTSLEKAMQLIKGGSSHQVRKQLGGRREIWQPGFHEATIRDHADYLCKICYVNQNPVVARFTPDHADWIWGSASQRYNLDPIPQGLKPVTQDTPMSELKLRPPTRRTA